MACGGRTIKSLQGEVKILTGGIVREHAWRADKVKFLDRRYSPDGRSIAFCLQYVCAPKAHFLFVRYFEKCAKGEKWAKIEKFRRIA